MNTTLWILKPKYWLSQRFEFGLLEQKWHASPLINCLAITTAVECNWSFSPSLSLCLSLSLSPLRSPSLLLWAAKRSQSISNCVHLCEALPATKSVPMLLHTVSSFLPGISHNSHCSHRLSGNFLFPVSGTERSFPVFYLAVICFHLRFSIARKRQVSPLYKCFVFIRILLFPFIPDRQRKCREH